MSNYSSNYSEIVKSIYRNYNLKHKYKIDTSIYNKIEINIIIALIINDFVLGSKNKIHKHSFVITYKNKNYFGLMHYVYELLQLCDKKDFDNLLENTSYLEVLSKINNGAIILYKLKKFIVINKTKRLEYCYLSAENSSYNTFKFWYDDEINNLIINFPDICTLILRNSIINPDERIYKFLLEKTKLTSEIIKNIVRSLDSALHIPLKYKIRRIKILASHIDIDKYFTTIVLNIYDHSFITHLYRMVIRKNNQTYKEILELFIIFRGWCNETKYLENLYIYLNDIEKDYLTINIGHNIINPSLHFSSSIRNLIKDNYKDIIIYILKYKKEFKQSNTIKVLCEEKLFNKYLYLDCTESNRQEHLLLFTRFYYDDKSKVPYYIKYNLLLHLLRLKMKRIYNSRISLHLNKIALLNSEISNYKPMNIPVLKEGSKNYQYNKQKFSYIPPRHLIASLNCNTVELQLYTNFLLREKPDGIMINDLPSNIYPKTDLFNNIKVKAEYIEDHDLYLVFDIDIPNTTIIERYELLRKAHHYTMKTALKQINNLNDFMIIMTQERTLIDNFMKEKSKIKWFPKFATLYSNNNNNMIVNHFIDFINSRNDNFKASILESKYYNCDGLILSPLDYMREIKIKPNNLLSIDLLYNGKHFVDYENNNMNSLLFINNNYKTNAIYRCYPDVFNNKFIVGEVRFDKHKPNNNSIITNICNLLIHKYQKVENNDMKQELYYEKKGALDYNLLNQLKDQTNLLSIILLSIEPKRNKKWLDLGCGSGKLINHIQKFNPDYYLGMDIDIKKLVEGSQDKSHNFIHIDLNTMWSIDNKFDYIVANFSIMHFFTDSFWEQLNKVSITGSLFVFNVPSKDWVYKTSYMRIDNDTTYYNFEWVHNNSKKEPYISEALIYRKAHKYKWDVNIFNNNHDNTKLVGCYTWYALRKL